MTIQNLTKTFITAVLTVSLAACSTFSGRSGGGSSHDPEVVDANDKVISSGIGEDGRFYGSDRERQNRLVAPHNQIYYFDFDTSTIHKGDKPSLNAQARYLASHPRARVLLTGNTDERGSREYNVALGERRAKQVRVYLTFHGVKPSQIRTVSYGEEKPIALGHNEAAYRQNRRVELIYEAK